MAKSLGNNPLLRSEEVKEPIFTEKEVAAIKEYQSDVEEFTTMSFKIRKTYLKKLRDYAYTARLSMKDALDDALSSFLDEINDDDLLESPERRRIPRRKRGANDKA